MPVLQAVVPQEYADAVEREAETRRPRSSKSRIVAEVVMSAFEDRAAAIRNAPTAKREHRRRKAK
jgi:hypothetical protein